MMHSCWVTFAKFGKPACEGTPDWPRYTPQGDQLMDLGASPQVRRNFRKPQLDAQEAAWRNGTAEAQRRVEDALRRFEDGELRSAE
jgi:carboxylesterase type B